MKKKVVVILFLLIMVIVLIAQYSGSLSFSKILIKNGLKAEEIINIDASTTMTDPKSDIKLKEGEVKRFIEMLNKFSYKKVINTNGKGWQYSFVLNSMDKNLVCSIMEDRLLISNEEYKIVGIDQDNFKADFLKLLNK